MKIINVVQGTAEWLEARAGIPTASELDQLLTPELKHRTGETPKTYLCRKLAEKWLGSPLQSFGGGVMEQGTILESEAIPFLEALWNVDIARPGFFTTDDGTFGCSPDGMIDDAVGVEIKCPQPGNHVRWLINGECPPEHQLQPQGAMYVTGASRWRFVSYCRGFPPLEVWVDRDAEAMAAIDDALDMFNEAMSRGWFELVEANGGPPKRAKPRVTVSDDHPF